mmetsp:Transcript_11196/g.46655  ORF Transcript_11196/g.46655 Transcript_11196/m.46655 type:complete len:262 (+) Transcript_11196:91-876(+)
MHADRAPARYSAIPVNPPQSARAHARWPPVPARLPPILDTARRLLVVVRVHEFRRVRREVDLAAAVGAALLLGLLVAEILAPALAQDVVGLLAPPVLAERPLICVIVQQRVLGGLHELDVLLSHALKAFTRLTPTAVPGAAALAVLRGGRLELRRGVPRCVGRRVEGRGRRCALGLLLHRDLIVAFRVAAIAVRVAVRVAAVAVRLRLALGLALGLALRIRVAPALVIGLVVRAAAGVLFRGRGGGRSFHGFRLRIVAAVV